MLPSYTLAASANTECCITANVIPAQAGIQPLILDSRFRGKDGYNRCRYGCREILLTFFIYQR
jgi:hypothetical protein